MLRDYYNKFKKLKLVYKVLIVIFLLILIPYLWWAYLIGLVVYFVNSKNKKSDVKTIPSSEPNVGVVSIREDAESLGPIEPKGHVTGFAHFNEDKANPGKLSRGPKAESDDFQTLVQIYNRNKTRDWDEDARNMVKEISPLAEESKCPYCYAKFDFKAARARKCPKCGEHMVVRRGLFITDKAADEIEQRYSNYFDKKYIHEALKYDLDALQNLRIKRKTYTGSEFVAYFRKYAEAFTKAAQIEDVKDQYGYGCWDRAWSYFGSAKFADALLIGHNYYFIQQADIELDMAEMLLSQARVMKTAKSRTRHLLIAFSTYIGAQLEAIYFKVDYFRTEEVVRNVKALMARLGLSNKELIAEVERRKSSRKFSAEQNKQIETFTEQVKDFVVLD